MVPGRWAKRILCDGWGSVVVWVGNAFETSVFSELVKKYGKDSCYYWRTKDKKEIDFILKDKNKITPIEIKLNFLKFNPGSINYFNEKYELKDYKVIGLRNKADNTSFIFPWEL